MIKDCLEQKTKENPMRKSHKLIKMEIEPQETQRTK